MRYLKYILAAIMILCAVCTCALAEDGATVITTAEELAKMEYNGSYVLGNDIALSGQWTPIGFGGTLDGAGHKITGLNINCTNEFNVGLFSWLEGTVSNLTIENASITASHSGGCNASIIGTCPDAWSFDPAADPAHIFNCHVSGTIKVSSDSYVGGSGLIGAQDSTADVDITVEGSYFMSPALWGCRNSTAEGTMTVTDLGGGNGEICAIVNSSDCESDVDITVECDDPESSQVMTYGIHGRLDVRSYGCINNGDITSPAHAGPISNGDDCESTGKIVSDRIVGMYNCTGSVLSGEMSNYGVKERAEASFISDTDAHENASNESDADYTFEESSATTEVYFSNHMMPGDVVWGDITINAGAANVTVNEHFEKPEDYEKHVYNHGDVSVTTSSGNIDIFRNTATTGSVTCVSDTGEIEAVGGLYNSGNVSARSNGYIHALGANQYNSGSVSITCGGSGTAIGAYGEGALNVGSVTTTGDSSEDIGAVGAGGTGSTNSGPVSCTNSGSGDASATGVHGENCLNTGDVFANNTHTYYHNSSADEDRAFSNACGASGTGSFNTGSVTANGTCYCVHAFGISGDASSTGTVTAIGNWIANADGDCGPATANGGQCATATGAQPSASNGRGCSVSNETNTCWYFESHHSRCILSHAAHHKGGDPNEECIAIDSEGRAYVCGMANYDLGAETRMESDGEGTKPDAAEEAMPEEDEPERDGKVEIALFGEKSEDYAIPQFTYALGSFGFPVCPDEDDFKDHTEMYARITVINKTEETKSYKLKLNLPDGFSAQPWSIQKTIDDITITVGGNSKESEWIPVYPLYSASCPESVKFSVTGDLKGACAANVQALKKEGVVFCRATGWVNPNDSIPIEVKVNLDCVKDMVKNETSRYNGNLALMTCAMSQAVYQESFIEASMENLGFTCFRFEDSSGSHDVASAYGMKKVVSDGVVYPIIAVAVRGTVGLEWIGNFNVGNDTYHEDFEGCANETLKHFSKYCIDMNFPKEHSRAFFGAHSRAAATTNLLAAELNSSGNCVGSLTAYCYAPPNSTKSPRADANIFNIVYVDDVVAYVPQGYFKNGVTFVVGELDADAEAPAAVADYFNKYCSRSYMYPRNTGLINLVIWSGEKTNDFATNHQVEIGEFMSKMTGDSAVGQAHGAENYLAWTQGNGINGGKSYEQILLARKKNIELVETQTGVALEDTSLAQHSDLYLLVNLINEGQRGSTLAGVFCPVDVTLRDADGNVVAKIVDNEITETADSCMFAAAVDEHHLFGLDVSEDYTFDITGTGSGTMRIEMVTVDENIERVSYVSFLDIPVAQGETYDLEMTSGSDGESWKVVSGSGVVYYPGTAPAELPRTFLPAALTVLDDEAFLNASSMTGMLVCPDTMTSIGASAFSGSGFQAVLVPAGVTDISDTAFEGCNAVIHCYEGSPIHAYALEKGIAFTLIE